MGITIPKPLLEDRLEDAVRLAESDAELPAQWTKRAEHISQSPSQTYIAALGVALLAKATDPRVDVLAIKASSGATGYSMRSVAAVLAGRARHYGYHLGVTGPEPLNNQPWFGSDRIDQIARIRAEVVPFHQALIRYLRELQRLDPDAALRALAAFLRLRLAVGQESKRMHTFIANPGAALSDVLAMGEVFIRQSPEGGKRGQAVVAGMLDCVHDHVQTGAINNPRAFDVRVDINGSAVLVIEVKQKGVSDDDVRYLAAAAAAAGVDKAIYAALAADQGLLDATALRREAADEHGVFLGVAVGLMELSEFILLGSSRSAEEVAAELPRRILERLDQLRVSQAGQAHWSGLFLR